MRTTERRRRSRGPVNKQGRCDSKLKQVGGSVANPKLTASSSLWLLPAELSKSSAEKCHKSHCRRVWRPFVTPFISIRVG